LQYIIWTIIVDAYRLDQGVLLHWSPQDEGFILRNINLYVKHSFSIAMIGKVGLGKSAFLSCILGEMEKVKETAKASGNITYVTQCNWIQNGTI
jgi:ABC-type phosphate transport system ATPase subunit